jgi:NADH-quinone oxidoreductase subunit N
MMVMVSGYSLLTLYLGLEILSLSLYTLIAIARNRASAIEAKAIINAAVSNWKVFIIIKTPLTI